VEVDIIIIRMQERQEQRVRVMPVVMVMIAGMALTERLLAVGVAEQARQAQMQLILQGPIVMLEKVEMVLHL